MNPHSKRQTTYIPRRAEVRAKNPMQPYPKRFILFGEKVVSLRVFLQSEMRTNHSFQKIINRLGSTLDGALRSVQARDRKLELAAEYIQDLKKQRNDILAAYDAWNQTYHEDDLIPLFESIKVAKAARERGSQA